MQILHKYGNESSAFRFICNRDGLLSLHYFEFPEEKFIGEELIQAQNYTNALVMESSERTINKLPKIFLSRNKKETTKTKRKPQLLKYNMTHKIVNTI